MSVLKLVGVLLDYPREELWEHGEELLAACDDPRCLVGVPQHGRDRAQGGHLRFGRRQRLGARDPA